MYPDRYKVYGSPKKKQLDDVHRPSKKDIQSKLSTSPKKKIASPMFIRKSYLDEEIYQENNHPQREQIQYNLNCEKDSKLSVLIYEAISSADRVVKQILNYELPQFEGLCSKYFLTKQKLYLYLHSESIGLPNYKSKNSKLSKFKSKKQENIQEEKEEISLQQLKRLESIVYNTIIPFLQEDKHRQRKTQKYSKMKTQMFEIDNPEHREGIYLLQKLSSKSKRFNLDDYTEVLQKYIIKVMKKQTNLQQKIAELQKILKEQNNKVYNYENFIKKREEEKLQNDIQRANQLKRLLKYEEFVNKVQSILNQEEDYFTKEAQSLESLTQRIRLLKQQNEQKGNKYIDRHKSSKQQTELSHSRQQKLHKDVIRNLNKQIGDLKQLCQQLEQKIRNNNDEKSQALNKERKLIRQNETLCKTIQQLTEDLSNSTKMVQQYLEIIGMMDQELKLNQDHLNRLQQEKQRQEQQKKSMQEKNEQLLKHLQELENRYRQSQELGERKEKQFEQLVHNLYSKQKEIKQMSFMLQKYEKQIENMNSKLFKRQENIHQLEEKMKILEKKLIQILKQSKNLQIEVGAGKYNNDKISIKNIKNSEDIQPLAIVFDDFFIDKSEPNHQRQDFIPIHRIKDQSQNKQTAQKMDLQQINVKLLSQLAYQKQNNQVYKKSQIIEVQSQNPKNQEVQFIKIEDDKQIQYISEKSNPQSQKERKQQKIEVQSSYSLIKAFQSAINNPVYQKHTDFDQKVNKKITKHQIGIQTSNLLLVQNFVQSQVVQRFIPEIKRILSKQEANQTINQSLIDELELFNTGKFIQSMKLERGQHTPLQQNKLLQAKLQELLSLNYQLKRQVAFLKAQKRKDQKQKSEDEEEVANFNQLADQLQNEQIEKQHQNIKDQSVQRKQLKIVEQTIPKVQIAQNQQTKQQEFKSPAIQEFDWRDLVPQYFSERCIRQ